MRILDERQTGMFSYWEGICNQVKLSVENQSSMENLGIERSGAWVED
jgi:hypothetical protein